MGMIVLVLVDCPLPDGRVVQIALPSFIKYTTEMELNAFTGYFGSSL